MGKLFKLFSSLPHFEFRFLKFRLITLWETGLSPFWIKNITNYAAEKCFDKNQMEAKKSVNPQVPIKLGDLLSAFFILGAGIGLSIASFILELITGKFIRQKGR